VSAPARSTLLRTQPSSPALEKLGTEESRAIGTQLIVEIQTLPEDDLRSHTIAVLKAKNRLSAEDAKRVEEAFAARMAPQDASSEVLPADEPQLNQVRLNHPWHHWSLSSGAGGVPERSRRRSI
jgi:hypothetical protein